MKNPTQCKQLHVTAVAVYGLLNSGRQISLYKGITVSTPRRAQHTEKTGSESLKTLLWWHGHSLLISPSHSSEFLYVSPSKRVFMLRIGGNYAL